MKHSIRKQRKTRRKHAPQKRIRSNSTRTISLKRINQIIQRSLKNSKEAKPHAHSPKTRSNPRNRRGGSPAEDEEAGGEEDGSEHHGEETCFGDGAPAVGNEAAGVEAVVEDVSEAAEDGAEEEGEEGEFGDDGAVTAVFGELDWESGEAQVEDTVDETCLWLC